MRSEQAILRESRPCRHTGANNRPEVLPHALRDLAARRRPAAASQAQRLQHVVALCLQSSGKALVPFWSSRWVCGGIVRVALDDVVAVRVVVEVHANVDLLSQLHSDEQLAGCRSRRFIPAPNGPDGGGEGRSGPVKQGWAGQVWLGRRHPEL